MAEILALGISHYPPLSGHDDRMAAILQRMMQNPKLPPHLRTPEGWPEGMRAEWGEDQGTTAAALHRAALVGWMARVRAALDAFEPDFVLLWGDDQYENFREDIIPPYCIAAHDKFTFSPRPNNVWGETDKVFDLPGNRDAAKMLATGLIEQGSTQRMHTSRYTIRSGTPSPTQSSISTTIGRAFVILSCRSR